MNREIFDKTSVAFLIRLSIEGKQALFGHDGQDCMWRNQCLDSSSIVSEVNGHIHLLYFYNSKGRKAYSKEKGAYISAFDTVG